MSDEKRIVPGAWTEETWGTFCGLLRRGWPGEFEIADANSYAILLDGIDPERCAQALKLRLHGGHRFRPSVAELLETMNSDPTRPTFVEAYRLIFGPRGILRARPTQRTYADHGERRRLHDQAAVDRAKEMHPLVGAFVAAQGLDRLRTLELDDPDWGEKRRLDLEAEWNAFVEANHNRELVALTAGTGRAGLRQLNPLTALGLGDPGPVALNAGEEDQRDG